MPRSANNVPKADSPDTTAVANATEVPMISRALTGSVDLDSPSEAKTKGRPYAHIMAPTHPIITMVTCSTTCHAPETAPERSTASATAAGMTKTAPVPQYSSPSFLRVFATSIAAPAKLIAKQPVATTASVTTNADGSPRYWGETIKKIPVTSRTSATPNPTRMLLLSSLTSRS